MKTSHKVDLSLVAQIVRSYVAQNNIAVDQVAGLIAMVHRSFSGLGKSAPVRAAVPLEPAVPIRRSVQHDHVVCLECGFRGQTLRRHLRVAWARIGSVSRALETGGGSSFDGAGLLAAAFDDGKAERPRETARSRRVDAGSGSGRASPEAGSR